MQNTVKAKYKDQEVDVHYVSDNQSYFLISKESGNFKVNAEELKITKKNITILQKQQKKGESKLPLFFQTYVHVIIQYVAAITSLLLVQIGNLL